MRLFYIFLILEIVLNGVYPDQVNDLIRCVNDIEPPCQDENLNSQCVLKYGEAIRCLNTPSCISKLNKYSAAEYSSCIKELCHSDNQNVQDAIDQLTDCLYTQILSLSILTLFYILY